MSLFESIRLPFCDVLMTEAWNAPAGRYCAAFRTRHGFRWLFGHPVLEEFGTVSSPLFFTPHALLGKIYDAGISLGHRRNHDMDLDLGWPPLCVGLERDATTLPPQWQEQLLDAITAGGSTGAIPVRRREVGGDTLEVVRFDGADRRSSVSVIATSAPLLPHQLRRLCDSDDRGLTVALALGNRITRQSKGSPQPLVAASEARIGRLAAAASELFA